VRLDLRQLQRLCSEYGRLWSLEGHTYQSRGQRLNGLLAEMLGAWGHRARADLNARGNIDVAFAIDDQRFILEAKWERSPTATGSIAKLQKRVKQRLAGTIGVFVSMSGYTPAALADVKDGERLEVILLDNRHVEAMLAGFYAPSELFNLMLDSAHFYGDPTRSLEDLLEAQPTQIDADALGSDTVEQEALRVGLSGMSAEWIASGLPFGQSGVSTFSDGRLLLTTGAGLLIADPGTGRTQRMLDGAGVTNARALCSGEIAVVRRHGVAAIGRDGISVRGGPFGGRVTFANHDTDDLIVFSNDADGAGPSGHVSRAVLAVLGDRLGDASVQELDYPASQGFGATLLRDGGTLVLGNPTVLFDSSGGRTEIPLNLSNPFAAAPALRDGQVLVSGGDVELVLLEPDSGVSTSLGTFNLHGSIAELAMVPGSRTAGYVYAHHQIGTEAFGAVVRFDLDNVAPIVLGGAAQR
jgi:hypothetical protein